MGVLTPTADGRALATEFNCEMCRMPQWPGDEDWQLHLDEVEEVEISWAHGDQGLVRRLATRGSYDLCLSCAVQFTNLRHAQTS